MIPHNPLLSLVRRRRTLLQEAALESLHIRVFRRHTSAEAPV